MNIFIKIISTQLLLAFSFLGATSSEEDFLNIINSKSPIDEKKLDDFLCKYPCYAHDHRLPLATDYARVVYRWRAVWQCSLNYASEKYYKMIDPFCPRKNHYVKEADKVLMTAIQEADIATIKGITKIIKKQCRFQLPFKSSSELDQFFEYATTLKEKAEGALKSCDKPDKDIELGMQRVIDRRRDVIRALDEMEAMFFGNSRSTKPYTLKRKGIMDIENLLLPNKTQKTVE